MRDLFLLDPDIIFLNHGSFGACPREVFDVYQRWQLELERRPVEFLGRRSADLLEEARRSLAELVGANADDLVFITNTTTGVNTVARSLRLEPGDEILSTNQEYGACDNVWEHVCAAADARYVKRPVDLPLGPPPEVADAFMAGVTPRTRAIYVSHMTSTTALLFPVAEICRQARSLGIPTVIDGAHIPGHVTLDLNALGADIYIGNCHKWLGSPKGAAFIWATQEWQERLDALVISWGYSAQVEGHTSFDAYVGKTTFIRRHQWQGTRDIAAFLSIPAAIDFQRRHDWDRVRSECWALARETLERIQTLTGLPPLSTADAFRQMVAIPLPPCDLEAWKARLCDHYRIEVPLTSHRDLCFVRPSFQGYNTRADADALVSAVGDMLHRGCR